MLNIIALKLSINILEVWKLYIRKSTWKRILMHDYQSFDLSFRCKYKKVFHISITQNYFQASQTLLFLNFSLHSACLFNVLLFCLPQIRFFIGLCSTLLELLFIYIHHVCIPTSNKYKESFAFLDYVFLIKLISSPQLVMVIQITIRWSKQRLNDKIKISYLYPPQHYFYNIYNCKYIINQPGY